MKKTLLALTLLVVMCNACKTTKVTSVSDAENYVKTFLGYMNQKEGPKRQEMMDCIAPSYINENKISTANYKVNNYSIWGYSIEAYESSSGLVVTKVWGEAKGWIHELTFKVVSEKGKLYLMPGKHSDAYIDPWMAVKTYVKE